MEQRRFAPASSFPAWRRAAFGALAIAVVAAGCRSGPLWRVLDELRVSDREVARALDDRPEAPSAADLDVASAIPELPMPAGTRPCCAFGNELRASIGGIPVLGYAIDNVRAVRDLDPHRYDNGALTIGMNDARGWTDPENNAKRAFMRKLA